MISPAARKALVAKVAQFLHDQGPDAIARITAQQAYDQLYPDHIDFGTFHHAWQHVLSGAAAEEIAQASSLKPPA